MKLIVLYSVVVLTAISTLLLLAIGVLLLVVKARTESMLQEGSEYYEENFEIYYDAKTRDLPTVSIVAGVASLLIGLLTLIFACVGCDKTETCHGVTKHCWGPGDNVQKLEESHVATVSYGSMPASLGTTTSDIAASIRTAKVYHPESAPSIHTRGVLPQSPTTSTSIAEVLSRLPTTSASVSKLEPAYTKHEPTTILNNTRTTIAGGGVAELAGHQPLVEDNAIIPEIVNVQPVQIPVQIANAEQANAIMSGLNMPAESMEATTGVMREMKDSISRLVRGYTNEIALLEELLLALKRELEDLEEQQQRLRVSAPDHYELPELLNPFNWLQCQRPLSEMIERSLAKSCRNSCSHCWNWRGKRVVTGPFPGADAANVFSKENANCPGCGAAQIVKPHSLVSVRVEAGTLNN